METGPWIHVHGDRYKHKVGGKWIETTKASLIKGAYMKYGRGAPAHIASSMHGSNSHSKSSTGQSTSASPLGTPETSMCGLCAQAPASKECKTCFMPLCDSDCGMGHGLPCALAVPHA
jgi:hypothetical protein